MKRVLTICTAFVSLSMLITSCSSQNKSPYPGYTEQSGLYVQYHKDNDTGRTANLGDIVSMDMMYKTEGDSVIMDSRQGGQPVQVRVDTAKYKGDIMGVFEGMNVGDSASIIVSADSFFLKTAGMPQLPDFIDSASNLYFTVNITEVKSLEEMQAAQQKASAEAMQNEMTVLQNYLEANNVSAEPTASGMYFISKKKGTGAQAEAGKKVKVHYEGMLLDGTYFDTSVEEVAKEQGLYNPQRDYSPFEFTLGQGMVIKGWDEGVAMMKEGGKARFIIPSNLAYGANPRPGGPIKPYSTLIFDVELIEVLD
ncbi:MAG: FKBP-type peptidyl-prolyl cis-trans isomerase [Vicingaceae bacterium]